MVKRRITGVSMWEAAAEAVQSDPNAEQTTARQTNVSSDEFSDIQVSENFKSIKDDAKPKADDTEDALSLLSSKTEQRPKVRPIAVAKAGPHAAVAKVKPAPVVKVEDAPVVAAAPVVTAEPDAAPVSNDNKPKRNYLPILAAAASVVAVVFVAAQNWPSASASQSASEPINPSAASADTNKLQEQAMALPSVSESVSLPVAPEPAARVISFKEALVSDSPHVSGKSLEQLAQGKPEYSPIEGLPDSEWRGKECSSCHTWDQATLCAQGQFYKSHGLAAVERKEHPYGGAFKQNVMAWANDGCN